MGFYIVESYKKGTITAIRETSQRSSIDRDYIFDELKHNLKDLIVNENNYRGLEAFETKDRIYYKSYLNI